MDLADQLLGLRLPGVIGMQFETQPDFSDFSAFATKFYNSLAVGDDLDIAVRQSRRQVGDHYRSSSPVLFLRSPDGVIFPQDAQLRQKRDLARK